MAAANGRIRCFTCNKEKATSKCAGCLKDFCYNHLGDHRQQLAIHLDEIEVQRDLFRQTLTEQATDPQTHPLIEEIEQWKNDSIDKIHKTAEELKQILFEHTSRHTHQLEGKLNTLTNQIRECREENDIMETDLSRWQNELTELNEQLIKPQNITIQYDSTPLVTNIHIADTSSLNNSNDGKTTARIVQKPYVNQENQAVNFHLSKALSWLLRHAVTQEGIQYQYDGYVFVEDVLRHSTFSNKYTIQDIRQCVETNEKQRFVLKTDQRTGKEMIRAQPRQ
ncbi:unnamed protein product [Adineta ricciae]|uniref:2'-phosphotransferase n=1 Tax=Adineta ricciae TaxID=249248 RepID=A0A815GIX6_ADIRI|nr:unnamed protein product [Adineta ricciae]